RLFVDVLGEALVAPVPAHARVEEILVHRGELAGEDLVQQRDDLRVALHWSLPDGAEAAAIGRAFTAAHLRLRCRGRRVCPRGAGRGRTGFVATTSKQRKESESENA